MQKEKVYFIDAEPMTLQEIAQIEGVSKQRIDEILKNAMRKARQTLWKRGITVEILR